MSDKTKTFSEQIREAHPDLAVRQVKNARKRLIAVQLRALRRAKGMTQAEVAKGANMNQSMIARPEALSGPVPGLVSIERYVEACGGQMALWISPSPSRISQDCRTKT